MRLPREALQPAHRCTDNGCRSPAEIRSPQKVRQQWFQSGPPSLPDACPHSSRKVHSRNSSPCGFPPAASCPVRNGEDKGKPGQTLRSAPKGSPPFHPPSRAPSGEETAVLKALPG